MQKERTVNSQRVFHGKKVGVRVDTIVLSNGKEATREIVEHGDAVVVVPVTEEREVVLVRQYRRAVGKALLEAPAGGLDEGESPEDAAARELREETGYTAEHLQRLGGFWMTPGFCTEYMHAFLAMGLRQGEAAPEEDEHIQVERIPLPHAIKMVHSGEVEDAKSVATLLMVAELYRGGVG